MNSNFVLKSTPGMADKASVMRRIVAGLGLFWEGLFWEGVLADNFSTPKPEYATEVHDFSYIS